MARGIRSTKQPATKIPGRRRLFGKAGYFPVRTGRRAGVRGTTEQAYPDQPMTWGGTLPEWAIYWAHLALGLKEFEDFEYQYQIGGYGSDLYRLDFYDFDVGIGIDVQGLYWHYGLSSYKQVDDLERKVRLEALGYPLVFIDEDMALQAPVYYLREARVGRDHSRAASGSL